MVVITINNNNNKHLMRRRERIIKRSFVFTGRSHEINVPKSISPSPLPRSRQQDGTPVSARFFFFLFYEANMIKKTALGRLRFSYHSPFIRPSNALYKLDGIVKINKRRVYLFRIKRVFDPPYELIFFARFFQVCVFRKLCHSS